MNIAFLSFLLGQVEFPKWDYTIGDPTLVGWFTVFCYFYSFFLSILICFKASKLFNKDIIKQFMFWFFLAIIMLFLGINKQLDLQSYFTEILRYYAKKDHWYEYRHTYQILFIQFMIFFSIITSIILAVYFIDTLKINLLAIFGLCFVVSFVVIRAASFHHVDNIINQRILDFKMNWILELFGLSLIIFSALNILKKSKKTSKY